MKKVLLLITLSLIVAGCSKDKVNKELREFIRSQEHDEYLIGWWVNTDDADSYILYDDVDFKKIHAYRDKDGVVSKEDSHHYWYTKDGELYSLREATPLTGVLECQISYRLSDDKQTLMVKDAYGQFFDAYRKVDPPL